MQQTFIAGTVGNVRGLRDAGSSQVFNFSVSVSNGKNADGSWRDSTWYDVGVWGKRGEALSRFVAKGMKVSVSGRPSYRVYNDKPQVALDAQEVTIQGGGGEQPPEQQDQQPASSPYDDDSIPF